MSAPSVMAWVLQPIAETNTGLISLQWQWVNIFSGIPESSISGGNSEILVPATFDFLTQEDLSP